MGRLLPAAEQLWEPEGESLANPTLNQFVSFDDGRNRFTPLAQLFRLNWMSSPGLLSGPLLQGGRMWATALCGSVDSPQRREVFEDALDQQALVPDGARSAVIATAAGQLTKEIRSGQWLDRALDHFRQPEPYELFPNTPIAVTRRLLHDVLLECGAEPGGRGVSTRLDATRHALAAIRLRLLQRVTKLEKRHASAAASRSDIERVGVILVFSRFRADSHCRPYGGRELRVFGGRGVPLTRLQRIYVPSDAVRETRALSPGIPVLPAENLLECASVALGKAVGWKR